MHRQAPADDRVVTFQGPGQASLVGILSLPPADVPRRKVLFILSHGGLIHKVGAYRAHKRFAEYFRAQGCTVFRFDPLGMGDSDGDIETMADKDLFGKIESGFFLDSYRCAYSHLEKDFADYEWIVAGVCGGAASSLMTGVESPHRIAGYALISCPVVLDGSQFDYSKREGLPFATRMLRPYLSKLTSTRAIFRFLTLQSDYKKLAESGRAVLRGVFGKLLDKVGLTRRDEPETDKAKGGKPPITLSARFVDSYMKARKRSKLLFIYGDNDNFLWEFNELFAKDYLTDSERSKVLYVVARANHMFIWPEWQDEAFEAIRKWMDRGVVRAR